MQRTWASTSVQNTQALAARLAQQAEPGDIFALTGQLASGKTTFVQGFCAARGVTVPVNSPTFTLINEYPGDVPLYHFDCYRLTDESELHSLGFEEYFYGRGIVLIEWADRIASLLPDYSIHIRFEHNFSRENSRTIYLESTKHREELCVSLP